MDSQYTPTIQDLDDDELLSRLILSLREDHNTKFLELRAEVLKRMAGPPEPSKGDSGNE